MPDRNRGKQPKDDILFAPKWHPILTEAVNDLGYLLSRGYADSSALEMVGNRYKLNKRQRHAVLRISSSEQSIHKRKKSLVESKNLKGQGIEIDGFNLLILLESALSGAYIFKGRDGTYRDISSVHGSYKRVVKTEEAIRLVGQCLQELQVKSVKWYFDQPVSNSGRLKTKLMEISLDSNFDWEIELVFNPDKDLAISSQIVVSSDGWVIEHATQWFNLGAYLIENKLQGVNIMVL